MEKKDMLEQLISHFFNGNKAKFALMLGVRPQTINTWLGRNTFDVELIYTKCEVISGDWLLNGGNGNMFRSDMGNAVLLNATNGSNISGNTTLGNGATSSTINNYGETCANGEPSPIVSTLTESIATLTRELETSQKQKSRLIGIIEQLTNK